MTCVLTVEPELARYRFVKPGVVARRVTVEPTFTAGPLVSDVAA